MSHKKIIGAGVAAAGFILFSLLVWPLFQVSSELRANIASRQDVLEQKKAILEKINILKSKVGERKAVIGQLEAVVPLEKSAEEVVVSIEESSRQSGVDLRDFKTATLASGGRGAPYHAMQVELNGSGVYSSILDFFKLLEKNLRIFDVQDFTISLDASGTVPGRLNLDLRLLTYYLESPKQ